MGFFSEFKDFAMRGNVVDLAVGLIIGAEFGKIVNSAVNDLIMPPIGKVLGGTEFTNLKFSLGPSKAVTDLDSAEAEVEAATSAADAASEAGQEAIATATGKVEAATASIEKFGKEVSINYGTFIQNVFNFLIIAFAVFMVVKIMNSLQKKDEEEAPAPAPPKNEVLLEEIRDLLAKK